MDENWAFLEAIRTARIWSGFMLVDVTEFVTVVQWCSGSQNNISTPRLFDFVKSWLRGCGWTPETYSPEYIDFLTGLFLRDRRVDRYRGILSVQYELTVSGWGWTWLPPYADYLANT